MADWKNKMKSISAMHYEQMFPNGKNINCICITLIDMTSTTVETLLWNLLCN